jgi:hypothetical protein
MKILKTLSEGSKIGKNEQSEKNMNDKDLIDNLDLLLNMDLFDEDVDLDLLENFNEIDKTVLENSQEKGGTEK